MTGTVECHSGSAYAERPLSLLWQGERLEITQVLGEWRLPDGKRFRVQTGDEQVFELFYNELEDDWCLQQVG